MEKPNLAVVISGGTLVTSNRIQYLGFDLIGPKRCPSYLFTKMCCMGYPVGSLPGSYSLNNTSSFAPSKAHSLTPTVV